MIVNISSLNRLRIGDMGEATIGTERADRIDIRDVSGNGFGNGVFKSFVHSRASKLILLEFGREVLRERYCISQ